MRRLLVAACAPLFVVACSSPPSESPSQDDDSLQSEARRHRDAGAPPPAPDAAPPPLPYPAFSVDAPSLVSRGGPVLSSPKLQVVTFAGDPLADTIEDFASRLGASSYWREATSEYGVGAMEMLPPIRLTEVPAAHVDDADVRAWLAQHLVDGDPDFGAPDASTIYALFYPATTTITIGTQLTGCVNSGGYHWDTTVSDGTDVPYVVMPRCASLGDLQGLDVLTSPASHELAEAATDPLSRSNPAYFAMDDAHFAFADYYEAEIGDLCVQDRYLTATPDDVGYAVQRLWSNASAAAGHHPCVPAPPVYFNAQPVLPSDVTVAKSDGSTGTTRGVVVPLGRSATIELRLFSDAPTAHPWSITAYDVATVRGPGAELSFSLDQAQGSNGDVVRLTITRTKTAARGFSEAMLWSQLDGQSSFWPFVVGQ